MPEQSLPQVKTNKDCILGLFCFLDIVVSSLTTNCERIKSSSRSFGRHVKEPVVNKVMRACRSGPDMACSRE
jgi:hypothetical protein